MISFSCPAAVPSPGSYLLTASGCQDYIWTLDGEVLSSQTESSVVTFTTAGEHTISVSCAAGEDAVVCKVVVLDPTPFEGIVCQTSSWEPPCQCEGSEYRWNKNVVTYGFGPSFPDVFKPLFVKAVEEFQNYSKCIKLIEVPYTQADIPLIFDTPQPGESWLGVAYDLSVVSLVAFNDMVAWTPGLFADTALHELIHAMRVFDHAPTSDNIMFDTSVTSFYDAVNDQWAPLGPWDVNEVQTRYCSGDSLNRLPVPTKASDVVHQCPGVIVQEMLVAIS